MLRTWMMAEGRAREFSTPTSGRKWGPKAHRIEDDEVIPMVGAEAEFIPVPNDDGKGGGDGGGDGGGGRRDLTIQIMEEQIKEMCKTIEVMKKNMEHLKKRK